jgi:hypothetical protein
MSTTIESLIKDEAVAGSLRILVGETDSGKHAIYITGTRDGLRLLARLLDTHSNAPDNEYCKLERDAGQLGFTTDDSVDVFEIHKTNDLPEAHR